MTREHRQKLLELKSECIKFADSFNKKCEEFFHEVTVKGSHLNSYFNTIHELKLKSYDEFFEEAKVSKNARK